MLCIFRLIKAALLMVFLVSGCDNYDDYDGSMSGCDGADARSHWGDGDSSGCSGPGYEILLDLDLKEDESSAEVDVFFIGDSYDENEHVETQHGSSPGRMIKRGDTPFEAELEIKLNWSCDVDGEKKTEATKITKVAHKSRASTTLTGLPAQPSFGSGDIECELNAEVQIPYYMSADEERGKLATTELNFSIMSKDWVESELDYLVKLKIEPTRGDTQSYADVTATIFGKDGKTAVKKGDQPFDEKVDVSIMWECNKNINTYRSDTFVIDKNKASANHRITLPGVSGTSDALSCEAEARASINSSEIAITKESVPFVIGDRVLDIFVQDATSTQAMSYRVTEDSQDLSTAVQISITGNNCGLLIQMAKSYQTISYGTIDKAEAKSSSSSEIEDIIFLIGTGNSCKLLAASESKTGESESFAINTGNSPPFTLNKSNATLSASSGYSGKAWVFLYDSTKSSSDLVAYLDADKVTSATKLKASAAANAGDASLNNSKKYIVFAEVNGVLHVFLM